MWSSILKIAITLLGLAVNKIADNRRAKKAYLEFIEKMDDLGYVSVNLNEADRSQMDELRRRRKQLDGGA